MRSYVSRWARALRNRLRPACLVLCYHRVSDDTSDHWRNAVSVRDFNEHVALLSERYTVVSIDELAEALGRGKPPGFRTVAITFDDGYAVNLQTACDILVKHGLPATFYLNTAWLEGPLFWWDDLVLGLADAEPRPSRQAPLEWLCRETGVSIEGAAPGSAALDLVRSGFKTMSDAQRRDLLRRFRSAFDALDAAHAQYAPMAAADIRTLARNPLFTVAGHTHSHPSLASLPQDGQRAEILENKRILEEIVGRAVTHFSYPFGAEQDFDGATIEHVRAAGFRSAATTTGGPVRWPGDPFRIPRLSVKNWDVRRFEAQVRDAWAS